MKVYDNYEISPCKRFEEPDSPGKFYFEVSEADEADVWTLYGHMGGEGVEAIGDFGSREHAEEVYSRITGQAFPASYQSGDRLRLMHAGADLLAALQYAYDILGRIYDGEPVSTEEVGSTLQPSADAIAEATGIPA
jgi:hypothetical protein